MYVKYVLGRHGTRLDIFKSLTCWWRGCFVANHFFYLLPFSFECSLNVTFKQNSIKISCIHYTYFRAKEHWYQTQENANAGPQEFRENKLDLSSTTESASLPIDDEVRIVSRKILQSNSIYRQFNDFNSILDIASPEYSSIKVYEASQEFKVGDVIKVHIHLRDWHDKATETGGDMLRIWMSDRASLSNSSGYVIDHGTGNYTGILRAVFPGKPEIKVSIAQTKEHVGIYCDYLEKEGIWYYMKANYKNRDDDSAYCSTIPKFTWGEDTCNFTDRNYGMSWYCGKPRESDLACDDWVSYSAGKTNILLLNDTFKELYRYGLA